MRRSLFKLQSMMPKSETVAQHLKLEVCVDTASGLDAAQTGTDTIELCSALEIGGLTPSAGLIERARSSRVDVHAMIRARAGDFTYNDAEMEQMLHDIACVRRAGLSGIVIGAIKNGALDLPVLHRMVEAAKDLSLTLHRAIDCLDDPFEALDQVVDLGFKRILTSGGAPRAVDGAERLRRLVAHAGERIEIVVGSGVSAGNVSQLARETGATSFHASCSTPVVSDVLSTKFGFATPGLRETDAAKISEMRATLDALVS
ncbi:copper homeostasis protein CutC [Halocynthiibacter sp. C4]|uniref:copper homeostasis protein CutC n=1 Tax=Halocynthiibacter sp. C4 TaxID=2992758 RepID=UPI00237A3517|nr:copper homeostasis protein CutC [Halocynthiibacter sp. C4]MDE0589174.1 copper homeostasis protein CutC [Halocynthiibacter sp. C4]